MKSSIKCICLNFIRIIAFVCFLLTFIPELKSNANMGATYLPYYSISWIILLIWSDSIRSINLSEKGSNKWLIGSGVGVLICRLISVIWFVSLELAGLKPSIGWNGYIVIAIIWIILGIWYLVLGLTKTIDDSEKNDKTIPYSD